MEDKAFLGTGMKFPPQVNKTTGRFVTADGLESVKESVYIILMTQKTERIFAPYFGSRLLSYTFMDTNITALNIMARDLKETILTQEPRISQVDVDILPERANGRLIVTIRYEVAAGHTRDNLVFPFYLDTVNEKGAEETDAEW